MVQLMLMRHVDSLPSSERFELEIAPPGTPCIAVPTTLLTQHEVTQTANPIPEFRCSDQHMQPESLGVSASAANRRQ